jgi:RecA/RadA recombinase
MKVRFIRPTKFGATDTVSDEDESFAAWLVEREIAVYASNAKETHQDLGKIVERAGPSEQKTAFERLVDIVGNDLIEVFGDAGSGKSRLLGHIALEAQNAGKQVLYLDDENSLPASIKTKLKNYQYVGMKLDAIVSIVATIKTGFDLICLDSIGYPVLVNYVELSLREQLRAIQKMILLRAHLKDYAIRNKGLAIATNQPVSEYSIATLPASEKETAILEPFGGKGSFIAKLLLRTEPIEKGEVTRVALKTYKARDLPFDKTIAEFVIANDKTELRWA